MDTTSSLPSSKNLYDTIFLIGLITIMLITVVSFLAIQNLTFVKAAPIESDLNLPSPEFGVIEEQV